MTGGREIYCLRRRPDSWGQTPSEGVRPRYSLPSEGVRPRYSGALPPRLPPKRDQTPLPLLFEAPAGRMGSDPLRRGQTPLLRRVTPAPPPQKGSDP